MVAMTSMMIVIAFIALVINLSVYISSNNQLNNMADYLLENEGVFPERFYLQTPTDLGFEVSIESRYETRFFSTLVDKDNNIISSNLKNIAEISNEEVQTYVVNALRNNNRYGYISHYKYGVSEREDGTKFIIFINASQVLNTISNLRQLTFLIAIVGLMILLLLIIALSNKAIRPYIVNMERQQQFVADAGHEIKTPLAVISADVEVLEMAKGENEWTKSIKGQIIRLDGLIKQLLSLAKMDGISKRDESTIKINYSELAKLLYNDFKNLAATKGTTMESDIDDDIFVLGKHDKIEQLLSLILENSTKYAVKNSVIHVELKSNKRMSSFKVINKCEGLTKDNLANLFERFYRGDTSHSNQIEGYGIGLSVAQVIVQSHHGKITASLNDDNTEVTFEIRLPLY
jgi:signal transduction histidine kinase